MDFHILFTSFFLVVTTSCCPCDPEDVGIGQQYHGSLCVYGLTSRKYDVLPSGIKIRYIESLVRFVDFCDVIVVVTNKSSVNTRICPETCKPKLSINVPHSFIDKQPCANTSITCSLTSGMISNISSPSWTPLLLDALYWRRIQECSEKKYWHHGIPNKYISIRRKVYALLIWIGTKSNLELLHLQYSVLNNYTYEGTSAYIGWLATEDVYDCRNGTLLCSKADHRDIYLAYMPTTGLARAGARTSGWACAQRRPLRSLAHTLLLFDPSFVIMGDDDTYINVKIFHSLDPHLLGRMSTQPVWLGRYSGARKVSPRGFFTGGGGYLIGSFLLSKLTAYVVRDLRRYRDPYSTALSLVKAVLKEESSTNCSKSCFERKNRTDAYAVPLSVRLIDLCTTLLAGEYNCHHRYGKVYDMCFTRFGTIKVQAMYFDIYLFVFLLFSTAVITL